MLQTNFDLTTGLGSAEAALRLARDGANELSSHAQRTLLSDALALVREPMSLLLVACGAIYLVLGDVHESIMLLAFVLFIMGITLVQERKTERALAALRDMTSPRALVIRDGRRVRIPGREVVSGDLLVLSEGDRVPADVAVLDSSHLTVDESLLTGESVAVRKTAWDGAAAVSRPGGEDLSFAFAGTLVVEGTAVARVHTIGAATEIGRIGAALERSVPEQTTLQRETRRLVRRLAWVGGALSLLVVVVHGVARSSWLEGLLAGITLAMAILPNEFPVVVTIFLALGAQRLAKRRVLTRRIPAIEAIGSATVLCVDKTGTLTENRMAVQTIAADGESFDARRLEHEPLPEAFHEAVEYSILASRQDPFDPMERAFKELGEQRLAGTEHLHPDWTLVREYPLSRELLAVTQVWRAPGEAALVVATKGAPEAVADLCHLDEQARTRLRGQVERLGADGLRVLAVARGRVRDAPPAIAHDMDYEFVGLVGLADPVRKHVPRTVAECHAAGIRVVMITGDYPATAAAIAGQIGLDAAGAVVTGTEVASMTDAELQACVGDTAVFARVLPEQKLRIVEALRTAGEIVAMTGDGVNDAPALKAADIGVAMGGRGTDVAREAATLVLLDDDFASLVDSVRSGRRIIDNLRKALAYILAVHVPIVGLTLIPIFLGWPLVLLPIHIAFLHLVIDPACSVVFEAEPEEADVMLRPPRDPRAPLFDRRSIALSLVQGALVMLVVVAVYGLALSRGRGEADARGLTFTTFMVANLGLIFTNRTWSRVRTAIRGRNAALWWVTGGAVVFLALVLYVPGLRELFRFAPLRPRDILFCIGAGVLSVSWFEAFKAIRPRERHGIAAVAPVERRALASETLLRGEAAPTERPSAGVVRKASP
ncbi:cation-translocating P-type ATPase [Nannocystis bainbridge]|uniref:Cation-translocating P-type ATPase n=1 Tax=Nannocystis bainbridge TaxID=2995303 RepID=A0ABT5E4Q0_9BACT|nr:cation-translocating P-type ATPase [Nannocystis bainbridge]MDC0720844.1 cation-translocating P-type ATPase [Nannocystis bainbridge]